jgi:hypothetical protein
MTDLTDAEFVVLAVLAMQDKGTHTPDSVTRILRNEQGQPGATRQGVARTAGGLVTLGLARRVSLPRMTYYEISPAGRAALEDSCRAT